MKIFIAGNSSPNPEDWSIWDEVKVVIANSIEEVEELTWNRPIVELELDKVKEPFILADFPEPNQGEDI